MSVVIIDYGIGNLNSVRRAFEESGADVLVSQNPENLASASQIVLPGVGAFADGMALLKEGSWIQATQEEVLENKTPILGICLGMQLMADKGFEGGGYKGLGLIAGEVKRLEPHDPSIRIPHVGWNEIKGLSPIHLLKRFQMEQTSTLSIAIILFLQVLRIY
ncbi:MAG: hypothetical protein IEMM0008_0655 [bacterium]|nr:MAG: hypothetical protein IEMM0008_0655 [bacterium]